MKSTSIVYSGTCRALPGDLVGCDRLLYKEPVGPNASHDTTGALSRFDVGLIVCIRDTIIDGISCEALVMCTLSHTMGWTFVTNDDLIA